MSLLIKVGVAGLAVLALIIGLYLLIDDQAKRWAGRQIQYTTDFFQSEYLVDKDEVLPLQKRPNHEVHFHLFRINEQKEINGQNYPKLPGQDEANEIRDFYWGEENENKYINTCVHVYHDQVLNVSALRRNKNISHSELQELYLCLACNDEIDVIPPTDSKTCKNTGNLKCLGVKTAQGKYPELRTTKYHSKYDSTCESSSEGSIIVNVFGFLTPYIEKGWAYNPGAIVGRHEKTRKANQIVKRRAIATFIPFKNNLSGAQTHIKDKVQFTRLIAHEFGHTFDLTDYIDCKCENSNKNETLMTQIDGDDEDWCNDFSSTHHEYLTQCRDSYDSFFPGTSEFTLKNRFPCTGKISACNQSVFSSTFLDDSPNITILKNGFNSNNEFELGEPVFIAIEIDESQPEHEEDYSFVVEIRATEANGDALSCQKDTGSDRASNCRIFYPPTLKIHKKQGKVSLLVGLFIDASDWIFDSEGQYSLSASVHYRGTTTGHTPFDVSILYSDAGRYFLDHKDAKHFGSVFTELDGGAVDVEKLKDFLSEVDECDQSNSPDCVARNNYRNSRLAGYARILLASLSLQHRANIFKNKIEHDPELARKQIDQVTGKFNISDLYRATYHETRGNLLMESIVPGFNSSSPIE